MTCRICMLLTLEKSFLNLSFPVLYFGEHYTCKTKHLVCVGSYVFLSLLVNVVIFYQTSNGLLETSVWVKRFSEKSKKAYIYPIHARRTRIRDVYT